MKKILSLLFLFLLLRTTTLFAQVQNVIVETYYISDANDATDTTDGRVLPVGSKTYRVYVELKSGCKLRKIYGDANHTLKIMSTDTFFNNINRPNAYFGYLINKLWFPGNPTLALDSWFTLGRGAKNYTGVLKSEDTDGSFIGGTNNYGGSSGIPDGLLIHCSTDVGIPLTVADGFVPDTATLSTWLDDGFKDMSGVDTTIFGSVNSGTEFISNSAFLQQNSGVVGCGTNKVLVAQLTTKGDISFELNIEVLDEAGNIIKYVADGSILLPDERISPRLKYPPVCGCTDASYLEYSPSYACNNPDSCRTRIVFGCMDVLACNYSPNANYNIQSLCCYPGFCNDRDIAVVCPTLMVKRLELYPNPAKTEMTLEISSDINEETKYAIYDSFGRLMLEKNISITSGTSMLHVEVENLKTGVYMLRLFKGDSSEGKMFMKN